MGFMDEVLDTREEEADQANMPGVATGVVKENWDKDHPGMLKVEISLGTAGKNVTGWAPVAVPYAGKEFGTYFLPEIGTQVLVAFRMGNVSCPVVIGCLWNKDDVLPPETAVEKNTVKTIRTKGGNCIQISEEKGKELITIETTGKQKLVLDDENKKMILQDEKAENAVMVDTKNGEMEFICKKKATFKINGSDMLILDGSNQSAQLKTAKIHLDGSQELKGKGQSLKLEGSATEMKGQTVKIESQAAMSIKGTASLKAESSGITEVKGTMVKIN